MLQFVELNVEAEVSNMFVERHDLLLRVGIHPSEERPFHLFHGLLAVIVLEFSFKVHGDR